MIRHDTIPFDRNAGYIYGILHGRYLRDLRYRIVFKSIHRVEIDRVRPHENGVRPILFVSGQRRIPCQQSLLLVAPITGIIAECKGPLFPVEHLHFIQHQCILRRLFVDDRIGPCFLIGRHDIGIIRKDITLLLAVVRTLLSRQKLIAIVPDIRPRIERGNLRIQIVGDRIRTDHILRIAHLDVVHPDHFSQIGIVIPLVRLHQVVLLRQRPAAVISPDVVQRIEGKISGIQRSILIHHLDQRRIDPRLVQISVIIGLVAIYERTVLIDHHIAVTVHLAFAITNRTVTHDDSPVMKKHDMPYQTKCRRIPHLDTRHLIGPKIDRSPSVLVLLNRTLTERYEYTHRSEQRKQRYTNFADHRLDAF